MYDHELDAGIRDFEGIFGLGLPYKEVSGQSWLKQAAGQKGHRLTLDWAGPVVGGKEHLFEETRRAYRIEIG